MPDLGIEFLLWHSPFVLCFKCRVFIKQKVVHLHRIDQSERLRPSFPEPVQLHIVLGWTELGGPEKVLIGFLFGLGEVLLVVLGDHVLGGVPKVLRWR